MLQEKELDEFLAFAHRTLDRSRGLLLEYSRKGFSSELKGDQTVVTEADTAAERLIREEIGRHYPSHGILGEEYGGSLNDTEFQWIIDPIDGTANFLTGIPTFGTILALFFRGEPVVGLSDHPLLARRYFAKRGGGVYLGTERLRVRGLSDHAILSPLENIAVSSRGVFEKSGHGYLSDRFFAAHPSIRVYRDVFAHGLVASGALGGMVEWANAVWDLAVARLFTEEAGGEYFEFLPKGLPEDSSLRTAIFGAKNTVQHLKTFFNEAIPV